MSMAQHENGTARVSATSAYKEYNCIVVTFTGRLVEVFGHLIVGLLV